MRRPGPVPATGAAFGETLDHAALAGAALAVALLAGIAPARPPTMAGSWTGPSRCSGPSTRSRPGLEGNPRIPARVPLARMLYFDTRPSGGHPISCNPCRQLGMSGDEGNESSRGHQAGTGRCNAPTVLDVRRLEEVLAIMGGSQLGRDLLAEEVDRIVAFLESLTGTRPDVDLPVMPPGTDATPRPEFRDD